MGQLLAIENTITMKGNTTKKTHIKKKPGPLFKLLCELAVIEHPAVVIPTERTLEGLIRANPPEEFRRRLEAFDPSNN
jgi:hypothetical protein